MRSIPPNVSSIMSQKQIGKMMRLAKTVAEDNNPCYSREVGCVITDKNSVVKGLGYNGPPRKSPHCDSAEYIKDILWPKLNEDERNRLVDPLREQASKYSHYLFQDDCDIASRLLDGCKTCPRRLLNYPAGVRPDICSCHHAEVNAIINAACDLQDCILFGWCITSCQNCTSSIINANIKEVHFLEGEEYNKGVWNLYKSVKIPVFLYNEKDVLK